MQGCAGLGVWQADGGEFYGVGSSVSNGLTWNGTNQVWTPWPPNTTGGEINGTITISPDIPISPTINTEPIHVVVQPIVPIDRIYIDIVLKKKSRRLLRPILKGE